MTLKVINVANFLDYLMKQEYLTLYRMASHIDYSVLSISCYL